jgi:hypothetical protein
MEATLGKRARKPQGTFEIHHLQAWPDCEGHNDMQRCEEHPPSCGVSISPTYSAGRQVIILRDVPWLGVLD